MLAGSTGGSPQTSSDAPSSRSLTEAVERQHPIAA
jgi:hypothetical protein